MFEVGEYYTIHTTEDGGTTWGSRKVIGVEMPLIKIEDFDGSHIIMNTAASTFVSAKKVQW